ncbi:MAG: hypothetical protein DI527_18920 [Chelatococcus sp.]|nr:MAG: hypothetical protein DI527_18920 [Chelatococcus sp.]
MKLSDIRINAAAIEQGEWIGAAHGTPIPTMGDLCLRVRGVGNSDYRKLRAKLEEAVPRSRREGGKIGDREAEEIFVQCLVETVLMDWSGVENEDGTPLEFSRPAALKIMSNPDLAPFKHAVVWAAGQVGELRTESDKAAAGN